MTATIDTGGRVRRPFGAYHRTRVPVEDAELTHVGAGTPGGEYLRCMWQPVCLAEELGDVPLCVRMLGEDLVLFRTRAGALGLVEKHCSHRGASLEYGLPTERGLQCCYHGWHFAPDGTVLETPNDPGSAAAQRLCHPAYPTHEHAGIVFAWMGDPDAVPVGDLHVPVLVTYALTGATGGDDDSMLELLEPYAGHRGRVVRLIKAAGIGPPRHHPAPTRFDISRI